MGSQWPPVGREGGREGGEEGRGMTSIILIYRVVIKSSSPSSSRARNARVRETVRERENLFTSLYELSCECGGIKPDEIFVHILLFVVHL